MGLLPSSAFSDRPQAGSRVRSAEGWVRLDVQVEARMVLKSWLVESPGCSQGLDQVGGQMVVLKGRPRSRLG